MFGIIRVSKTDYFRNGSGSSDPNRPKILKITVSYHMELGGVFKMAPSPQPPALKLRRPPGPARGEAGETVLGKGC